MAFFLLPCITLYGPPTKHVQPMWDDTSQKAKAALRGKNVFKIIHFSQNYDCPKVRQNNDISCHENR